MNTETQYSVNQAPGLPVIPTPGLPVIPAVEPESEYGGPFPDSGTSDCCLPRNDEFNNCSPVTLYSKPTIVIPATEPESVCYVTGQFLDSCLRRNDSLQNDVFREVLF